MDSVVSTFVRRLVTTAGAALLLAVVVSAAQGFFPRAASARIAALVAPGDLVAHDRYAFYTGIEGASPGTRVTIRVCDDAQCPVARIQRIEPRDGPVWTWIANAELPAGRYVGSVFVQVPTPLGLRTVDSARWDLEVQ